MLYRTHIAGGFITGYLTTGTVTGGLVSAFTALLPDIEDPHSFIGKRMRGISDVTHLVFGHRKALHSLLGVAGIYLLASAFIRAGMLPLDYLLPVALGYASHLVLDSFTPHGVPWFWPLKFRFRIPMAETGGMFEKLVITPVLYGVCLYLTVKGTNLYPFISNLAKNVRK